MGARIVMVEDHALLAETLSLALRVEGVEVVVAPLTDADGIEQAVAAAAPCLVMLDLDLGPIGDGVALIPRFTALGCNVLVVTGDRNRVRLGEALAAGASGFVTKDQPFDVLVETARRASTGNRLLDDNERQELLAELRRARAELDRRRAPFESLTPRERDVLDDLAEGKSVESIATASYVSTATVRTQVRGILTKLDVGSQLAAVAKARRAGWLSKSR